MQKLFLIKGIGWPTTWGKAPTTAGAIRASQLPPCDPVHVWLVDPDAYIDDEGELQASSTTYYGTGDISSNGSEVKNLSVRGAKGLPQSVNPGQDTPSQPANESDLGSSKPNPESLEMTEATEKKVKPFTWKNDKEVKLPHDKSKRKIAYDLIARPEGASYEELSEATGWNDTNVREGVRLLHKSNGVNLKMGLDGRIHLLTEDDE